MNEPTGQSDNHTKNTEWKRAKLRRTKKVVVYTACAALTDATM
jgi:hypothetical protein